MSSPSKTGLNTEKALKILAKDGELERAIKGFEPRKEQQEMMKNIIEAYNEDKIALIEAGTGTGKSFAYLIPAILWATQEKERTVISTHTIALQEQLLFKDIPLLSKALGIDIKAVLIKGMGNYICLRKLEETKELALLLSPEESAEIQKLDLWAQTTRDGSRSSLAFTPSSTLWEKVGAENDTCSNKKCAYFDQCHFFKARKAAADANLLIANHHLLFSDLSRRAESENYNEAAVLPNYSRVIIDEAHHIEDIATEYFASNINRLGLLRIMARLNAEKQADADGKLHLLRKKIQDFFNGKTIPLEVVNILSKLNLDLDTVRHDLLLHIVNLFNAFTEFVKIMSPEDAKEETEGKLRLLPYHQTHPSWNQDILSHVQQFVITAQNYIIGIESVVKNLKEIENEKFQESIKGICHEIAALTNRLSDTCISLTGFVSSDPQPNRVRWIDIQSSKLGSNIHLMNADLDISTACINYLFSKFQTIVLCSATLTTNQRFDFFRLRVGLTEKRLPYTAITEHIYDSPFNFQKQALLAVPIDMPSPLSGEFVKAAAEKIWMAIRASRGNAFVLFTSYSMLRTCYNLLAERLKEQRFFALKQGDENRQTLLEKFRKTDRSVLFGTDSFWEGVDVAGEALRLVIIVKLPFKVPTEPIIQARSEAILSRGGEPFMEYSLPSAIVKFKQGFGRLIRDKRDRGCIICLDTRLTAKNYGRLFLNSLPNCQKVFDSTEQVEKCITEFYRKTYYLTQQQPKN